MSNDDESKALYEFDSMNELENYLRFETRKECMKIIKGKIQNGESELYSSLFIDGILPYEPKEDSISVYMEARGRASKLAERELIITLRYSDHVHPNETKAGKMKTMPIRRVAFIHIPGQKAESWKSVLNRTSDSRSGRRTRMDLANGGRGITFSISYIHRIRMISKSTEIIMRAIDEFVAMHDSDQ